MSLGGKKRIPRANDWVQGMRLPFPMILVFSAGSRGQWKQTKSAVALWTPSPSPPMLQCERRGVGERMTDQHAGIVCRSHQLNRAKGSRDEVPCGVQRQSLWRLPQSTRGSSMKVSPTESRERVKGGTPLRLPLINVEGKKTDENPDGQ